MPYARIWYDVDGVKITYFEDGADVGHVERVLKNDGHVSGAATFEDFDTERDLRQAIPADRTDRHKWRKNPSGRGVRIDPTVPDPPLPR